MKASKDAEDKIKFFEGLRLRAYEDGPGNWAVGYGQNGENIDASTTITKEQAEALLQAHLDKLSDQVDELVTVELEQHQFDALVSLAYNIGIGAFRRSTLLRKLNEGDFKGAANQFTRWVYANGQRLPGLKRRRIAERDLFLGEEQSDQG